MLTTLREGLGPDRPAPGSAELSEMRASVPNAAVLVRQSGAQGCVLLLHPDPEELMRVGGGLIGERFDVLALTRPRDAYQLAAGERPDVAVVYCGLLDDPALILRHLREAAPAVRALFIIEAPP